MSRYGDSTNGPLLLGVRACVFSALLICLSAIGCVHLDVNNGRRFASLIEYSSPAIVSVEQRPRNTLLNKIEFAVAGRPELSERTKSVLRRHDLTKTYNNTPASALSLLESEIHRDPSLEKVYAFAEMAQIQGDVEDFNSDYAAAKQWYLASVTSAYRYLFDPFFSGMGNNFDPEFRGACDLYNGSLEKLLRIVSRDGNLKPGHIESVSLGKERFDISVAIQEPWHPDDLERIEFVADFEVEGLRNQYRTFGLGVPLIGVRRGHDTESPGERNLPANLAFPITAFLRIVPNQPENLPGKTVNAMSLELYDPLGRTDILVQNQLVPLESDISTPLAYFLNQSLIGKNLFSTLALLNADFAKDYHGLYMLEPYDPNRIPVVMVHGLWSSPITWLAMFNDLRGMPEIREHYQFWFYLYPTGQPFWVSAQQMRADLAETQQRLDPLHESLAMQQTVLVGHSMGGLISHMQTIDSGDDFWKIVSNQPFANLKANDEEKRQLQELLFFQPNPSIRRVVTLATPHRGSRFANSATRWLGRSLLQLPSQYRASAKKLIEDNPDVFSHTELLTIDTSLDSLSPDSPILPVLLNSPGTPWVRYHNIMGDVPAESLVARISGTFNGEGDGVVSLESAHFEPAASEIIVPADHTKVHQHPRSILEVRRILLEHLREFKTLQKHSDQTRMATFEVDESFESNTRRE